MSQANPWHEQVLLARLLEDAEAPRLVGVRVAHDPAVLLVPVLVEVEVLGELNLEFDGFARPVQHLGKLGACLVQREREAADLVEVGHDDVL
eukprot:11433580-Heterocapsa_arctica.AAC.1